MLPVHKYTEITSRDGKSQLIYIQYEKRKLLFDTLINIWDGLTERKQYLIIQKLLGLGLLIIGLILLIILKEGAGFLILGMGLLRIIFND